MAAATSATTDNAAASAALPAKCMEVLPSIYLKPVIIGKTRFFFLNRRYAATAAIWMAEKTASSLKKLRWIFRIRLPVCSETKWLR
ncbi:Uncharacterised protein [Neisseria meningitidis]|nr:Uncharacterised protein [Neisseria meningitidis]CWS73208.1 Uncharacterised protein [Neisseria meningitidis]